MNSSRLRVTLFVTWLIVVIPMPRAVGQLDSKSDAKVIGRSMAAISIEDITGQTHRLRETIDSKLVAVAFLGTECPLARQYAIRLAELSAEYSGDVRFIGVFSNDQDSLDEVKKFAREMKLTFVLAKDIDNRVADQFSALRTPEVFLLDRDRKVRYRGRIDDQHGIGYSKAEPTERNLKDAIDHLRAGRDIPTPETTAVGCLIGRVKTPSFDSQINYASHVAPIIQRHCVGCHQPGQIGPMSLVEADDVIGWAATIEEVVRSERMPPWHASKQHGEFANERRVTDAEKETLAKWLTNGAPLGDSASIPTVTLRDGGWQLAREPDLILPVSPEPVEVVATGELDYQHYRSEYVFHDDTWIAAAQILPGNHAVVHHILAFVDGPNGREAIGDLEGIDGYLAGYVPGLTVEPFPRGMAKKIPAGSKLIFQVHYTPMGTASTDQSRIGLLFADPASVTHEVITTSAIRRQLEIEPGNGAHQVTAYSHLPVNGAVLLGMMPHMHLRGKSFRYELQSADGGREILLDVPRYDFHWQTSYRLAEPKTLRAGDRVCCVAQFDNSTDNLNNPDPTQTVRWGDQTREEMMIGYFDIAVPLPAADSGIDFERYIRLVKLMDRFDPDRDGVVQRVHIPERWTQRAAELDTNGDSEITFAELAEQWQE